MKVSSLQFLKPKCNARNLKLWLLLQAHHHHQTELRESEKPINWLQRMVSRLIPHGGFESIQYSKPWSWSIGGWLISSGFTGSMIPDYNFFFNKSYIFFLGQRTIFSYELMNQLRISREKRIWLNQRNDWENKNLKF